MPTSTVEDYIKTLYALGQDAGPGSRVPLGLLARRVGVAPGTATVMMKRLAKEGLVDYESRRGAALAPAGRRLALSVLRRHRLIELFLVDVMGLDWSEVHREAEVLEHAASDRLLERIDEMLGRPEVDPHGDPIPSARGRVKRQRLERLDLAAAGPVRIARVSDRDPALLNYLESEGLVPDARAVVRDEARAADVIVLDLDDREVRLGTAAARELWVEVDAG